MTVEYGQQCPAYDCWLADDENHCPYCRGCKGRYANGVECGYSVIPTSEPKFKIGQEVHYLGNPDFHGKITRMEWDNIFEWRYYLYRERNGHYERDVFATRKERDLARLKEDAQALMKKAEHFSEVYKIPININKLLK